MLHHINLSICVFVTKGNEGIGVPMLCYFILKEAFRWPSEFFKFYHSLSFKIKPLCCKNPSRTHHKLFLVVIISVFKTFSVKFIYTWLSLLGKIHLFIRQISTEHPQAVSKTLVTVERKINRNFCLHGSYIPVWKTEHNKKVN